MLSFETILWAQKFGHLVNLSIWQLAYTALVPRLQQHVCVKAHRRIDSRWCIGGHFAFSEFTWLPADCLRVGKIKWIAQTKKHNVKFVKCPQWWSQFLIPRRISHDRHQSTSSLSSRNASFEETAAGRQLWQWNLIHTGVDSNLKRTGAAGLLHYEYNRLPSNVKLLAVVVMAWFLPVHCPHGAQHKGKHVFHAWLCVRPRAHQQHCKSLKVEEDNDADEHHAWNIARYELCCQTAVGSLNAQQGVAVCQLQQGHQAEESAGEVNKECDPDCPLPKLHCRWGLAGPMSLLAKQELQLAEPSWAYRPFEQLFIATSLSHRSRRWPLTALKAKEPRRTNQAPSYGTAPSGVA